MTGTLVKKAQNAAFTGLTLSASAQSDITVTSLTLRGNASTTVAGNLNAVAFATRVTSLALFDGDKQVGLAKAPDTTTALAQITNMNLVVPKGTTKTLTIKATLASSAGTAGVDAIAVGIVNSSSIQAQDKDSNTVTPTIDSALSGETGSGQLSQAPSVKQTILNSGTISLQADSQPVSNIRLLGRTLFR